MKNLVLSDKIAEKLRDKHGVCRREVEQCFENRMFGALADRREQHASNPPTMWFLSRTNGNRLLKIVCIYKGGKIFLRTAYEPDQNEIDIYSKKCGAV